MEYETILFEKTEDKVCVITLNRPQAMNSFNRKMCEEFRAVWERIRIDPDINAVVLRATPGRAFCAGVDVRDRTGGSVLMYDDLWAQVDPGEWLGPKQNRLWKPVVCAVHGMCAGGAFYWVNECDIVICSEDAQFFDPHVTYGMVAALEPIGLRQRIPLSDVLRMVLLGNDERIGAETALRLSLVSEIVALEKLWARAHELAAKIAAKPPAATQGSVRAIWESLDVGRTAALQMALKYCLLGNAEGTKQASRESLMAASKKYEVR
ncbi:MAG: enoyl-CoA hydratase/isomerase family protein [Caulobacteraceae bacterium]